MDFKRLQLAIFEEIDLLLKSDISDRNIYDKVYRLRNTASDMIHRFEMEFKALKKYNLLVDFLSKDNERVVLNNEETPYWLNAEIDYERPPGPTHAEIQKSISRIDSLYKEFIEPIFQEEEF